MRFQNVLSSVKVDSCMCITASPSPNTRIYLCDYQHLVWI